MTAYMHAVENPPSVQQEFRKLAVGSFSEAKRMFSSLQKLKTNSLRRIVFKEPGNFGLPTQRWEKVAISLQNIPVPYSILEAASFEERGTYVFICKLMDYLLRSCQSYDKFFLDIIVGCNSRILVHYYSSASNDEFCKYTPNIYKITQEN